MRPNLRIDRFDGGGHFDGDAAMVVGLVAVTVDELFDSKSEMPGWELALEEIWGPESARTHTLRTRSASHVGTKTNKLHAARTGWQQPFGIPRGLLRRSKCLQFAAPHAEKNRSTPSLS